MTVETPLEDCRQGPRRVDGDGMFINPYNFVSTPGRPKRDKIGLGSTVPAGHAAYVPGTYTGTIPITITTRTPLLLPDPAYAVPGNNNHPRQLGTRTRGQAGFSPNESPLLLGSSVKGMLRAAFEAITNSTYGVVSEKHSRPGSTRMTTEEAKGLRPGVVESDPDMPEKLRIRYLDHLKPVDRANLVPLPTPHVPIDLGTGFAESIGIAPDDLDTRQVDAWVHLLEHKVIRKGRTEIYYFWRVSNLVSSGGALPEVPATPGTGGNDSVFQTHPIRVRGRLHWTGAPFAGKHDERLVVTEVLDSATHRFDTVAVADGDRDRWDSVIDAYLSAHRSEPQATRNQRYGTYARSESAARRWDWKPGRTLYVGFDEANGGRTTWFTPAMIGRRTFAKAAGTLIPAMNRPATDYSSLSPADRVFGWVSQKDGDHMGDGGRAYRGQLRVGALTCDPRSDGELTIERFEPAVRLQTLNSPKPSQYRFYSGDEGQKPKRDGRPRNVAEGYARSNSRLRGRKFFLTHPEVFDDQDGASSYWTPAGPADHSVSVGGDERFREYLGVTPPAGGGHGNNVAVSVRSWVRTGTTFRTTLFVHNLTDVELGALLWLLALPHDAAMTLGLGKPLGFGAVRVTATWDGVEVYDDTCIAGRYRSLSSKPSGCDKKMLQQLVNDFDAKMRSDELLSRIRKEFVDIVFGFVGAPVHYPRQRPNGQREGRPAPQSETFRWWVNNEGQGNRYWLPDIGTQAEPTLPYLPKI